MKQTEKDNLIMISNCVSNSLLGSLGNPNGICGIVSETLSLVFNELELPNRVEYGSLTFTDRKGQKYTYGKGKGINIGSYHSWLVVITDKEEIIIDPTYKDNKDFLKKHFGSKLHNLIPDCLVTPIKETYFYSYSVDKELEKGHKFNLDSVTKGFGSYQRELVNHIINSIKN